MSDAQSPAPAVGLVVAHASLASALVAAAERICGSEAGALLPLSNEGCGPGELIAAIQRAIGDAPAVVFVDLGSGSCGFAARRVLLERRETALVSGVNLPMLLEFRFHRTEPLDQLITRLVAKGRESVNGVTDPHPAGSHSPASASHAYRTAAVG